MCAVEVQGMGATVWKSQKVGVLCGGSQAHSTIRCTALLPECQPLFHLMKEASMELIDWIDVGEKQGHQGCRHGLLLDHHTSEPLWEEFGLVRGSAGTERPRPLRSCDLETPSRVPPGYKDGLSQHSAYPLCELYNCEI